MYVFTLEDYAKKVGQERAAEALGMTQGGISKAIKAKRNVTVVLLPDGSVKAEERSGFPSQRRVND